VELFRMVAQRRGKRFVARSSTPDITALGLSAASAAENARLMAVAMLDRTDRPATLLLRIEGAGVSTLVMQPFDKPVSIDAEGTQRGRLHESSSGGDAKTPE
jgi:hypothetical protein